MSVHGKRKYGSFPSRFILFLLQGVSNRRLLFLVTVPYECLATLPLIYPNLFILVTFPSAAIFFNQLHRLKE